MRKAEGGTIVGTKKKKKNQDSERLLAQRSAN